MTPTYNSFSDLGPQVQSLKNGTIKLLIPVQTVIRELRDRGYSDVANRFSRLFPSRESMVSENRMLDIIQDTLIDRYGNLWCADFAVKERFDIAKDLTKKIVDSL